MRLDTPFPDPPPHGDSRPRLVLDTQVVMDWLVFHNPACAALDHAIRQQQVVWVSSDETLAECAHVLGRGVAAAWQPDPAQLQQTWASLSHRVDSPPPLPAAWQRLRCSDPDDQKFIDLALESGADWLLSRDKAVLRLARKVHPLGLRIATLAQWLDHLVPAAPSGDAAEPHSPDTPGKPGKPNNG